MTTTSATLTRPRRTQRFNGRLHRAAALSALAALPLGGACLGLATSPATAAAAPGPAPVVGTLLPVPDGAPEGRAYSAVAVDVDPRGVVVGQTSLVTPPYESEGAQAVPQRWTPGTRRWTRTALALPAGGSATVTGSGNLGDVGGTVVVGEQYRAARWDAAGRVQLVGPVTSRVTAVAPDGTVAVFTPGAGGPTGTPELVGPDGGRTSVTGPDLPATGSGPVLTVADRRTAVGSIPTGTFPDLGTRAVLWRSGATAVLPGTAAGLAPADCLSQVRPGGTLVQAYAEAGQGLVSRHLGGVPGRDVIVDRGPQTGPLPSLDCRNPRRAAAPDGGIAGSLTTDGVSRPAYWDPRGVRTDIPLAPGWYDARGTAAASGRRMAIRYQDDNGQGVSFWHGGRQTPLALPAGWSLDFDRGPVELTDRGLLVGNARDETTGVYRPITWNLTTR